jgi:hypothetical protein
MTKVKFERVYMRYDGEDKDQPTVRVKVNQLADGDWSYEIPGEFQHRCSSRECPDVDRVAMLILTG